MNSQASQAKKPENRTQPRSATAAARLTWHDSDLRFCSDDCLQLFVATPDHYSRGQP